MNQYVAAFLILEGVTVGIFTATDAMLFYVFFEAMLIPMFLIIGVWGGPRRIYAALKFFLYTFLGSVLMLVALVYLYLKGGSFQLADLYRLQLSAREQTWIFFAFLIAFAVKVPMFPVHTWLPDAHVEAPTGRFGDPGGDRAEDRWLRLPALQPADRSRRVQRVGMAGDRAVADRGDLCRPGGTGAGGHEEADRLFVDRAHGLRDAGYLHRLWLVRDAGSPDAARLGLQGAMVQMISHGFVSGAMFSCVGVLYDRMHSRRIADYGGVANVMPWFAAFSMLFFMANAGLPGTSGFVGEFMVVLASFQWHPLVALAAATTLIISAAYTLWLYKRVFFGEVANAHVAELEGHQRPRMAGARRVSPWACWPWVCIPSR